MDDTLHLKKEAFLTAFAQCGSITKSAKAAGCCRQCHYRWMEEDPEYPRRFSDAAEEATEALEDEARRRAVEGVERKRYNKDGDLISEETVYSDTLLIFLLNGLKPEKYKQRADVNIGGLDALYADPKNE